MGDEEQNKIMKKLLIILVFALSSSMSMFADFSNRGRYSDFTDHKSSIFGYTTNINLYWYRWDFPLLWS